MAQKVVGIAGGFRQIAGEKGDESYLNAQYCDAVESVGAVPLIVPPVNHEESLAALLDRLDALILAGGPDTPPERYGQKKHPLTVPIHPRRDTFDRRILSAALARKMPVLGICYGCQLINVFLGGTLIQHLPTARKHARRGSARLLHQVTVTPGTRLASIVSTGPLEVNSSHHQAVDKLAPGLRVSAVSEDGVIEAVESVNDGPLLGVQWHPEALADRPRHAALFRWVAGMA